MSPWAPVLEPERVGEGKGDTVRQTGSGSGSGSVLEEEEGGGGVLRVGGQRVQGG